MKDVYILGGAQTDFVRNWKKECKNVIALLKEVTDDALKNDSSVEGKAFAYIKSMGYNYSVFDGTNDPCASNNIGEKQKGGYCLIKYCPKAGESEKVYYKVTTFIALSIPIINVTVKLPISGETKALYYDVSTFKCTNG